MVTIEKVDFVATLFKTNSARVLGHDGAYSIPIKGEKVFWVFGDTLLGPERRGFDPEKMDITEWCISDSWARENVSMISNSGLIAEAKNIEELAHEGFKYHAREIEINRKKVIEAREIIPVPEKLRGDIRRRVAFWPFDGVDIDGKLYIFYFMVRCIMTKMKLCGVGLARSEYPYENFERLPGQNNISLKILKKSRNLLFGGITPLRAKIKSRSPVLVQQF